MIVLRNFFVFILLITFWVVAQDFFMRGQIGGAFALAMLILVTWLGIELGRLHSRISALERKKAPTAQPSPREESGEHPTAPAEGE